MAARLDPAGGWESRGTLQGEARNEEWKVNPEHLRTSSLELDAMSERSTSMVFRRRETQQSERKK